jgi:enterochelin esterase family protein
MKKGLLFLLLSAGMCWGQASGTFQPATTNVPGAAYPRIDADSRIEFRLKAPDAQKVLVQVETDNLPHECN